MIATSPQNALAQEGSLTHGWAPRAIPASQGPGLHQGTAQTTTLGDEIPGFCVTHSQPWPHTNRSRLAGTGSPLGDDA